MRTTVPIYSYPPPCRQKLLTSLTLSCFQGKIYYLQSTLGKRLHHDLSLPHLLFVVTAYHAYDATNISIPGPPPCRQKLLTSVTISCFQCKIYKLQSTLGKRLHHDLSLPRLLVAVSAYHAYDGTNIFISPPPHVVNNCLPRLRCHVFRVKYTVYSQL